MGTLWQNPGDDFSADAVAFVPPVDGPRFWNYFDSQRNQRRNLAYDEPWGAVVGSPPSYSGFTAFNGGQNYVRTTVEDLPEATFCAVAGLPTAAAGNIFVISTNGAGGAVGSSLYLNGDTAFIASDRAGGTPVASAPISATQFTFICGRFSATQQRIDIPKTGASGVATVPSGNAGNRSLVSAFYRVGSDYLQANGPTINIPQACIYARYLTDAEMAALYRRVKQRMAVLGLVI